MIGRRRRDKEKKQEGEVEGKKQQKKRDWEWKNVRRFGAIREGWVADLVGIKGDVREDIMAIRNVGFVMKDAEVVRLDEKGIRV